MIDPEDLIVEGEFRYDSWYAVFLSFLFWWLSYQILVIFLRSKSEEYNCRLITVVHGFTTAFVGINQCFLIDSPFDHPEWKTTRVQKWLLVTSLGYFLQDLFWCLLHQSESKLMIVHHIYSVIALCRMLFKGYSGGQAACALGSMEITNPLLQLRWFLRSEGYYPSVIYSSVEITFMIVFFLVRIVLGTFFLVLITFQPKNDWDFRIFSASIYIISCMFMLNISKYFCKKYGIVCTRVDEFNNKSTA